jgi:hypothetical protein
VLEGYDWLHPDSGELPEYLLREASVALQVESPVLTLSDSGVSGTEIQAYGEEEVEYFSLRIPWRTESLGDFVWDVGFVKTLGNNSGIASERNSPLDAVPNETLRVASVLGAGYQRSLAVAV